MLVARRRARPVPERRGGRGARRRGAATGACTTFAGCGHLPNLERPAEFNARAEGVPRRCLSCRRSSTPPGCRSAWASRTSCSATAAGRTRTSAGTCRARSRSCSARRRRSRDRETVQEFAVEVQRRLGRHGVDGQRAARSLRPRRLRRRRRLAAGRARRPSARLRTRGGVAAWPGELESGAVELQKTKAALEPRLEAVPTWQELARAARRRDADDPRRAHARRSTRARRAIRATRARGTSPARGCSSVERLLRRPGPARSPPRRSASSSACPRAPRSSRTATRARARRSRRSRSGPPATTRATTRARGTSGRATSELPVER